MNVQTNRALVAADTPAVRYSIVAITAREVVARDAELIIRDSRGVKTTCLNECATDDDIDGVHIRLGDLSAGEEVQLVLATEIGPRSEGATTAILLRLADRERVLYGAPMEVPWRVTDAAANRAQPVNREVIAAAAKLLAERARNEALELHRVRAVDRAQAVIAKAVARIRELGPESREINAIANGLEDVALQTAKTPARKRALTSAAGRRRPVRMPASAPSDPTAQTA